MSTAATKKQEAVPHSADAERAVLGAILLDPSHATYNQAAAILNPEDFLLDSNRRIFARMMELVDSSGPIDVVTVCEELIRKNELEAVGGATYLSHLTDGMPRLTNIEHYCRIVKEKALRRQLAAVAQTTLIETVDSSEETGAILDRTTERMLDLAGHDSQGGPLPLSAIFESEYESLDGIAERKRHTLGVSTGFSCLDDLTAGLQPSDLILVAARPSMGKTAFAIALARHVGLRLRRPVLLFSLEMSRRAVFERLLCAEAQVNSHRLRGGLTREEMSRVATATGRLLDAPIFIDDSASLNLAALRARARRVKQEHSLALCIVDYIGLMTPPRAENRTQEISRLSRGLKIAAKELDVPLVVVSQLSRAPEQRSGDHRPQLSDLRDSGSLEQDADLVLFLYRPEYYLQMANQAVPPDLAGMTELTIAKQRNGPVGTVPLIFTNEWAGFAGFHGNGGTR